MSGFSGFMVEVEILIVPLEWRAHGKYLQGIDWDARLIDINDVCK